MLYHTENQVAEAEKAYRRALDGDPSAPVAANNLAYIYAERGDNLDEALALAKAAAHAAARTNRSCSTRSAGSTTRSSSRSLAIPQFQQCVDKDPQNPTYQFHLGLAQAQAGDTQKARAALEQALKLNPVVRRRRRSPEDARRR